IQDDISLLWHALLNRFAAGAVFFAAEQLMQRYQLPVATCRIERRRSLEPVTAFAAMQQPHARIAGTQVAAHFILELVPGLWGVPARRPGEGNLLTVFLAARVAFHGKGEGAVAVLRLTRLMHADVGAHGGAAAVAVRF